MADSQTNININIDTSQALANLKALQSQISAFQTSMARGSATQAANAAKLRQNLVNDINATKKFSASIQTIQTTTESFTESLEKNKLSMGQYFKFAGASTKTFGKLFKSEFNTIEKVARERVKTLQTQYIQLGRDASGAMKAIAVRPLVLDMENLGTKTAIAAQKQQILNQLLKQGSTNMLNWGKNTQWAGRQLMVGFTIPLTMAGTAAAKAFMEMEEAVIKFKRVYGDLETTASETDKMARELQKLAGEYTKYGVAVSKTMDMAASAAATGKAGAELMAQVANATKLAVLGGVEQQQALETTISLTNAFGTAAKELSGNIDFLNAVENQTVTSIEDLTIAIPKAAPVIKQLGGDVKDLAFFLTAMREGGINASEGANALKSGIASMINPTAKASEFLAGFGINLKGIVESNAGNVKGMVVGFAQALNQLDPLNRARAIEQLFGKFQFARISTLFKNVTDQGSQAAKVMELTSRTSQELAILSERELKKVESSPMFKFKKTIEDIKKELIPIGEAFLKAITPIVKFAGQALANFNKMGEGAKNFWIGVTTVVAGVGPVLLMTVGLIANGVANLIKLFAGIKSVFNRTSEDTTVLGEATDYMTQKQLEAASVAASLEQVHQTLEQRFTSEAGAVDQLTQAYERNLTAQAQYSDNNVIPSTPTQAYASGGIVRGPGTGTSDSIVARISNGEAVIPAKSVAQNPDLVRGLISGNLPAFAQGFLGMPKSFKRVTKEREVADEIYQKFLESQYANQAPEPYTGQMKAASGHSFPIFGLGGVYHRADGSNVFVKPVMDEISALAELRGTIIAREAHGLVTPKQRIVVMKDPTDRKGIRRFLALESEMDERLAEPTGQFTKPEYFQQLLASALRGDKDLSADNVFGNMLPDVGTAGVFLRASGERQYAEDMPSVEEQATINLLGVKGGAKKAFAQNTADLVRSMTPEEYASAMREEIDRVLPRLQQTIQSLGLNEIERPFYDAMVTRLQEARNLDWTKFYYMHSQVQGPKITQSAIDSFANGGIIRGRGTGTSDSIIARVSNGEAIIPAKSVARNPELVSALVSGNIPGFAQGKDGDPMDYRNYNPTVAKYAPTGKLLPKLDEISTEITAELETAVRNAETAQSHAGKIFSAAITFADGNADALRVFTDKVKELIASGVTGADLKKQIRESLDISLNNQGDAFAHIGPGEKMTKQQALSKQSSGEMVFTQSDMRKILGLQDGQTFDVKHGLGLKFKGSAGQSINARMAKSPTAGTNPVGIDEYLQVFDEAGLEKWNDSISFGGGKVEELSGTAQLLDEEFKKLLLALPEGTKIFDNLADANLYMEQNPGANAVDTESIYARARESVVGTELGGTLDLARTRMTELRFPGDVTSDPSKRASRAKKSGVISEFAQSAEEAGMQGIGASAAKQFTKGFRSEAEKEENDPYNLVRSKKRNSPHPQAGIDGADDNKAYTSAFGNISGNPLAPAQAAASVPLVDVESAKQKLTKKSLTIVSEAIANQGDVLAGVKGKVINVTNGLNQMADAADQAANAAQAQADATQTSTDSKDQNTQATEDNTKATDDNTESKEGNSGKSEDEIAEEKRMAKGRTRARFQKGFGTAARIGAAATTIVGMASMIPGKIGEVAQAVTPSIGAFTTLTGMVNGPVTAALAGLIAVVGGIVMAMINLDKAYNETQQKVLSLKNVVGTSSESIRGLSEFAGRGSHNIL
jgi:TP901 family phage tail tape measure protein